ncbi:MAG: alpha/beta hydrolase [Myxococcota bacterium]|nr:alpha/beta hydrolase [Myxococcota bacterium]
MLSCVALGTAGCVRNPGAIIRTGPDDPGERIVGLYPCEEGRPEIAELDATRPLTVLVHGCSSSGARFRTLSQVFEAHGQQTICFNYNDRDFLNTAASHLATALGALERRWEAREINVLGHSQGGLIARRALQSDLESSAATHEGFTYHLVTVSSPLDGIASSSDCSLIWLHVLTLSTTVAVCLAITGNKWTEIPPGSSFMTNPAPLVDAVHDHLQIITDERESCRVRREDGTCETDDFVFGLDEQYSDVVTADPRVTTVEVDSGHGAIVGENREIPMLLIGILQQHGILAPTPAEREPDVVALLERLYAR